LYDIIVFVKIKFVVFKMGWLAPRSVCTTQCVHHAVGSCDWSRCCNYYCNYLNYYFK